MISENIVNMYKTKPADYYAQQMNTDSLRAAWFRKRQSLIQELVDKYYTGGLVLDIGCGNCLWNSKGIPTVGIDICEAMLRYNMKHIPSFRSLQADIRLGLPIKSNSVGMVVITEALEHFINYNVIIEEIKRVLEKDGIVVVSVPYSKLPGLWGLIFPLWCLYKGWRDADQYYSKRCGHVAGFNFKRIKSDFSKFVFLERKALALLTMFFVARKV